MAEDKGLLWSLSVGDRVQGLISAVPDFGLFIDIGGTQGLCTITDLSWFRVSHPGDLYQTGERVVALVLRIRPEEERLVLGIKQLTEDPWLRVPEKYPVGHCLKGPIVNVLSYGLFVELERGIEGLLSVDEIPEAVEGELLRDHFKIGQEVVVEVKSYDLERREIELRFQDLQES